MRLESKIRAGYWRALFFRWVRMWERGIPRNNSVKEDWESSSERPEICVEDGLWSTPILGKGKGKISSLCFPSNNTRDLIRVCVLQCCPGLRVWELVTQGSHHKEDKPSCWLFLSVLAWELLVFAPGRYQEVDYQEERTESSCRAALITKESQLAIKTHMECELC
jgi:hypothetical protein